MEQLPAVVELDRLCLGGLWTLEGYRRELESPNSDLLVLQPIHPTALPELVGLCCLWAIADEAHITVLAVHPQYQGQGLGQVLLHALLTAAHQRGLKWATLEVRVSNQVAIALYQKFGFETAGQRKRYYQDTGEDALILWRRGLQEPQFQKTLEHLRQELLPRLEQYGWQISSGNPLDLSALSSSKFPFGS